MTGEKGYTGIDGFRLIAAALVVAIHTSPLLLWGETADFVLTGVIARIAVPFFFMTSGFFLFAGRGGERERLKSLLGKTAKIYGFAMLFYLPLNVYTGYFSTGPLLPTLLRDVLIDGTVYHLDIPPAPFLVCTPVQHSGWDGTVDLGQLTLYDSQGTDITDRYNLSGGGI